MRRGSRAWVPAALGAAWAVACAPPEVEGTWVLVDLHVHSSLGSNDTDGLGLPDALGPAMEAAGLDVVFLTDHSNSQGSMDCPDVEDCPNRGPDVTGGDWPEGTWLASEISPIASLEPTMEPTGHTLCLPPDESGFTWVEAFIDRPPGEVPGGEGVTQCKEAGGLAIVAHPEALASWIAYDWTSEDFDGLEIYNGGGRFDAGDAAAYEAWAERVAAGRHVVPVGGSDSHRWGTPPPGDLLNTALGWPHTRVRVLEGETVVDALAAGRTVVEEPTTSLEVSAWSGRRAAGPGDAVDGPATVRLAARSEEPGLRLQLLDLRTGDLAWDEALGNDATNVGVEAEVEVGAGLWVARAWPEADPVPLLTGGVAIAAPIEVRYGAQATPGRAAG